MISAWRSLIVVMLSLVVGLIAWEFACKSLEIRSYLLPAPSSIAEKLWEHRGSLAGDTAISAAQAMGGFALAVGISGVLALIVAMAPSLRGPVISATVILKAIPLVILAPLLLVWCGYGATGKVILAAAMTFFPLVIAWVQGMAAATAAERDLFRACGATRWQTITKLLLPRSVPFLFTGLRVAAPMAVLGSLIAETAGATHGLGMTMMIAAANLNTALLFAAAVLAALLGLIVFGLVAISESFARKYLDA